MQMKQSGAPEKGIAFQEHRAAFYCLIYRNIMTGLFICCGYDNANNIRIIFAEQ